MLRSRKGFTLVELIIVIIIIGILAAIAAPMMSGNVNKAKRTEAIAAFGAIRTAERMYRAATSSATYGDWSAIATYLNSTDLNGTYYNGSDYGISGNTVSCNLDTYGATNMNLDTGTVNGA